MTTFGQIRALPGLTRLLIVTNGISALGAGAVMPFLWIYLTEVRHFQTWVPATTLAVQAAAAVLGGLAYGVLVDRLPYNRTVPLANVNAGVGTMVFAFATDPWVAIAAAAVFGFGISGVGTTVRAAYAVTTPKAQRDVAYSTDYGVLNLAMGFGVLMGGAVAAVGSLTPAGRYATLYAIDAVTFLLMAAATITTLPGRVGAADADESDEPRARAGYLAVLRRPELLVILLLLLLTTLATTAQFRAGLPGFLTQNGAITSTGLSFAFALNILLCAAVQFLGLPLLRRYRKSRLVAAAGVLAGLCWWFVYLAGQRTGTAALVLACVGVSLFSISEALVGPLLTTLLNNAVTDELRGRANGLFSITYSACNVLGPVVAGALLPWSAGLAFIVLMLALSGVATVLAVGLRRRLRADEDLSGESAGDASAGEPVVAGATHERD
ncbi:MFS transporter [Dactylosporangium sp. AC04546]|uniref:MFS transporter n=1 Tax=Dactylosporangium sp. AC04546 TaxID=2862460 RepID=UPI001EDD1853|nr:MFS transporter [Dactylosporangium sp. AC04546]WVK88766.1 MFS transporter [Dactylosporangium sp. AC04546]